MHDKFYNFWIRFEQIGSRIIGHNPALVLLTLYLKVY